MSSQFPVQPDIVTHATPSFATQDTTASIIDRMAFHYPEAAVQNYRQEWNDLKGLHTPLVKSANLLPWGAVASFADNMGRLGYVLGCGAFGNIVVFQRYADNPNYWMVNQPITTHEWGRVVGEQRPLTLAGLNNIAAVYGSIIDRETPAAQWFVPAAHR